MACSVDGCENRVRCRELCERHYTNLRRYGDPLGRGSREDRFWARVDRTDTCWIWTGKLNPQGYARARWGDTNQMAHRIAYELLVGPVPEDLTLDHLCRVRHCVRPSHLEPVTQRDNVLRGEGFAAVNAAKTHCVNGHAFDEANTYVTAEGYRSCRACTAAAQRRYRVKQRQ